MSTQTLDSPRTGVPGLRPVTGMVLLLALLLLGAAGVMTHDYVTYTGDDPLIGLAALAAIACAAPAALGLVLLGGAWLGRRRLPRVATDGVGVRRAGGRAASCRPRGDDVARLVDGPLSHGGGCGCPSGRPSAPHQPRTP